MCQKSPCPSAARNIRRGGAVSIKNSAKCSGGNVECAHVCILLVPGFETANLSNHFVPKWNIVVCVWLCVCVGDYDIDRFSNIAFFKIRRPDEVRVLEYGRRPDIALEYG